MKYSSDTPSNNIPNKIKGLRQENLSIRYPAENSPAIPAKAHEYSIIPLLCRALHKKGKIEACNKTIKYEFQAEAQLAEIQTLKELNTAFCAWAEVEYNKRTHSSTGESPDERFINGLPEDHRRVEDIEKFNAMFLWKQNRTITKYGKIKLHKNQYPVEKIAHGIVVQVRFDPFNLAEVYIYDQDNNFIEKTTPSKIVNNRAPSVPEESKKSSAEVSQDSINYFSKLREKYKANVQQQNVMNLSSVKKQKEGEQQ